MHKGQPLQKSFCPLNLTTPDESVRVADILLHPEPVPANVFRFANWIRTTPLLRRLHDVQLMLDTVGVLQGDALDDNLRAAMTLRDCTVFVRFPDNGNNEKIEARLGDLDVKSVEKMSYWKDTDTMQRHARSILYLLPSSTTRSLCATLLLLQQSA